MDLVSQIFFTGSEEEKKEVSREVKDVIKKAKLNYKNKVELSSAQGNFRSAWQGLKNMAAVNHSTSSRNPFRLMAATQHLFRMLSTHSVFFSFFYLHF